MMNKENIVEMTWQRAIENISSFVVRISTPQSTGTGFLVSHSTLEPICGIATTSFSTTRNKTGD